MQKKSVNLLTRSGKKVRSEVLSALGKVTFECRNKNRLNEKKKKRQQLKREAERAQSSLNSQSLEKCDSPLSTEAPFEGETDSNENPLDFNGSTFRP